MTCTMNLSTLIIITVLKYWRLNFLIIWELVVLNNIYSSPDPRPKSILIFRFRSWLSSLFSLSLGSVSSTSSSSDFSIPSLFLKKMSLGGPGGKVKSSAFWCHIPDFLCFKYLTHDLDQKFKYSSFTSLPKTNLFEMIAVLRVTFKKLLGKKIARRTPVILQNKP